MVFTACEEEKLGAFFIPTIGQAPKWCSYIENMTEEMEEKHTTTSYEDYKFLTKNELEQINASHLIGTKMLKPYMHGFFMDAKQYRKLKSITDPFAFEKYREEKINKKLEELRENRIVFQRKLPKVNSKFMEEVLKEDQKRSRKAKADYEKAEFAKNLLHDDRFSKLFKDKDFQINQHSEEYKRNKPVEPKRVADNQSDDEVEAIEKEDTNVLDVILGDSTKQKDKKKELTQRVNNTKLKILDRIAPIPEFKKKEGEKNALERRKEKKDKMRKAHKMPTPQEMRERKKNRRIAVPLSHLNK